ncbi:MAG TPA: metallophosphoesterase [Solirubrobacterales bacterium]|nr:metallophosphoesterase [Solirubrobacterales bacterium]
MPHSSQLKILVLSDIHFIKDVAIDTNAELSEAVLEFAAQIRGRFGGVDIIAVCGDIAYSGLVEEYARASTFLANLEVALGGARIVVIPGNHDIYLKATLSAEQRVLRGRPRQGRLRDGERDRELNNILSDHREGPELLEPLQAYLNFAAQFGCEFGPPQPYWEIDVPINGRLMARMRGLTSVLVSDVNDKVDLLLLSGMQTSSIARREPGVLSISLCHHPFEWLLDGHEQRDRLDHRCALQISGHVHRQQLRPTESGLHLLTGAMQPDRSEPDWESRINLVSIVTALDGEVAKSQIEVFGIVWDKSLDRYTWEIGPVQAHFAETPLSPAAMPSLASSPALDRLRRRLAGLSPSDRYRVSVGAGLDFAALSNLSESDIVAAMISQADAKDLLPELWEQVELRHGNQERGANPFR